MKYRVRIGARKVGAIGSMYVEKRTYTIEAPNREQVNEIAIKLAYEDGDIEHVRVETVEEIAGTIPQPKNMR